MFLKYVFKLTINLTTMEETHYFAEELNNQLCISYTDSTKKVDIHVLMTVLIILQKATAMPNFECSQSVISSII